MTVKSCLTKPVSEDAVRLLRKRSFRNVKGLDYFEVLLLPFLSFINGISIHPAAKLYIWELTSSSVLHPAHSHNANKSPSLF
jgi:hypothetical protein